MAEARPPVPVLLVAAVFSRHADILSWRADRLEEDYGPVERVSTPFVFDQTDYYAEAMGTDLRKQFLAFRDLVAPDRLADDQAAHQRPGTRVGRVRPLPGGSAGQHRSGLSESRQVPAGHHQGPGPSRLPGPGDLRRGRRCASRPAPSRRGRGPTPTTASRPSSIFCATPAPSTTTGCALRGRPRSRDRPLPGSQPRAATAQPETPPPR